MPSGDKEDYAVIYARQSVGDEEESLSVEVQVDNCQILARSNGLNVVGVFRDRNTSGTTYPAGSEVFAAGDLEWQAYKAENAHVAKRPFRSGLNDAFKALPIGGYLLVNDATRFMRPLPNSFISSHLIQKLKAKNAILWSASEGKLDYSKADTKLIATIREQIEAEAKERRRRASIEGKGKRKDLGFSSSAPPYGYKRVGKGKMEPIPEEVSIIRRIFQEYLDGKPAGTIARRLAREGVSTQKRGIWMQHHIPRLISLSCYIGMARARNGELIESRSYPAILEKGIWFAANDKLRSRPAVGRRNLHQHFLQGLLVCGSCGRIETISHGPRGAVYTCCPHNLAAVNVNRPVACQKAMVRERVKGFKGHCKPETFAHVGLADCLYPLTMLLVVKRAAQLQAARSSAEHRVRIENEKIRLKAKLADLDKLWITDSITTEAYGKMSKDLKTQVKGLEAEAAENADARTEEGLKWAADLRRLKESIEQCTLPEHELSDMLHAIINRVIVHPYSVEIYLWDNTTFTIERIQHLSARSFPAWKLDFNIGTQGQHKNVVRYFYLTAYKGDRAERCIYDSETLEIWTVGENPMTRAKKCYRTQVDSQNCSSKADVEVR